MTDTGIKLTVGMGGIYTALIYRANDKVRESPWPSDQTA